MHVHHCALATLSICRALESSSGPPPRTWRTFVGRLVLWRGRLPRGRATAPPSTMPAIDLSPTRLEALLDDAARAVERARALPPDAWFAHFALGTLRRDDALRFVEVHDGHHLRIVAEIRTAHEHDATPPA